MSGTGPLPWRPWRLGVLVAVCLVLALVRRPDLPAELRGASGGGGVGVSFAADGGGGSGERAEVMAPRRGVVASTVQAPGTVRAGSEAGVSAPYEGRVLELVRDTGDPVAEGEVLFRLDPTDHAEKVAEAELEVARLRAALAEAAQELAAARREVEDVVEEPEELTEARLRLRQSELENERSTAQLQAAKTKLERTRMMQAEGIARKIDVDSAEDEHRVARISERIAQEQLRLARETLAFRERTWEDSKAGVAKDLSIAEARHARAEADLDAGELALERARRDLEDAEVRSPLTGTVTGRAVNQGDLVTRLTGSESHYIVSDLSRLVVYADVAEGDVVHVAQGQPARVWVHALEGREPLEAVVYDVGYRAQQLQGQDVPTFLVRVLLRPDQRGRDRLRPGMTATVEVETARAEEALKIPLQAIVQREVQELPERLRQDPALAGRRATELMDVFFTVDGGRARVHLLGDGIRDVDEVEVAGLAEDAAVVVGPFRLMERIEDDQAVSTTPAADVLPAEDVAPLTSAAAEGQG